MCGLSSTLDSPAPLDSFQASARARGCSTEYGGSARRELLGHFGPMRLQSTMVLTSAAMDRSRFALPQTHDEGSVRGPASPDRARRSAPHLKLTDEPLGGPFSASENGPACLRHNTAKPARGGTSSGSPPHRPSYLLPSPSPWIQLSLDGCTSAADVPVRSRSHDEPPLRAWGSSSRSNLRRNGKQGIDRIAAA